MLHSVLSGEYTNRIRRCYGAFPPLTGNNAEPLLYEKNDTRARTGRFEKSKYDLSFKIIIGILLERAILERGAEWQDLGYIRERLRPLDEQDTGWQAAAKDSLHHTGSSR